MKPLQSFACAVGAGLVLACASSPDSDITHQHMQLPEGHDPSLAYQWMDVMLEATARDAFMASWDSKVHYDSSRPWTLVRHDYKGLKLGRGVANYLYPKIQSYIDGTAK